MTDDSQQPMGEKDLLNLIDAFIKSKVLMTAYRLNLFTLLAREPMAVGEALERLELPERSGTILVNACLGLGLLELKGETLSVPEAIAPLLIQDKSLPFRMPTYLIDYYHSLYEDMVNLEEIVKTDGAASAFNLRDYFKEDVGEVEPELAADYSAYMDATMAKIVKVVQETYSFAGHHYLFDLCGGTGTFCEAIIRANPGLSGGFIDIPAVASIGRARLAQLPTPCSIDVVAGDVFTCELPKHADVITICRSAHDWDDAQIEALFRRVADALKPDGRFLIIERMIPDHFSKNALPLYLRAVYFLSKSCTARYRTASQYQAALQRAGFARVETIEPGRDPYAFFQGLRIVMGTK